MKIEEIEDLLEDINNKIQAHEEEKNRLKESFNFFKVLGIETKEIYHSKFIAQLLNPKGLHGCGDKFLKIFLEILTNKLNLGTININNVSVITEFHMGEIPPDYSKGGSVDIFLKVNRTVFLIENKIYAGDQQKQIIRYNRHKEDEKANYNDCHILYLTLDGKCPSDQSCEGLIKDEHFHCISYQEHIYKWLEKCLKECPDQPIVKETIKGYLIVVKFLTNQTSYHKMQNEIKNTLWGNQNYLMAAKEISNTINIIKNESNIKIQKIYDLLDVSKLASIIGKEIIKGNCGPDGGYNMFTIFVSNDNITLVVCTDEDMFCYPYSEGELINFEKCKGLKEPYKAEDFIEAFTEDLKLHFK